MEKKHQSGKVVRLCPEQSQRTEKTLRSLPPAEHISHETARRILAGGLEKVAGPPPIKGWPLVFFALVGVGFVAIIYSVSSVR